MLRGVLQAFSYLSIHVTFSAFGPMAAPGATKMLAAIGTKGASRGPSAITALVVIYVVTTVSG